MKKSVLAVIISFSVVDVRSIERPKGKFWAAMLENIFSISISSRLASVRDNHHLTENWAYIFKV